MDVLSVLEALPQDKKEECLRQVGRRLFVRGTKLDMIGQVIKAELGEEMDHLLEDKWYYLTDRRPRLWRGKLLYPWASPYADFPKSQGELLLSPAHFRQPDRKPWRFIAGKLFIDHPFSGKPGHMIQVTHHAFQEAFLPRVQKETWPVVEDFDDRTLAEAMASIVAEAVPVTRVNAAWISLKHNRKVKYWMSRDRWILVISEKEDKIITLFGRGNLQSSYKLAE